MAVELNHTIVAAPDALVSATFMSEVLGLPAPTRFAHFQVVQAANGVSLDFATHQDFEVQHYAFLVSDEEFDEIFGRIQERGLTYYADPGASRPMEINRNDGGRGCYFHDPGGHVLEILTVPYGGG